MPEHGGVRLVPLVHSVDGFLDAMGGQGWPELVMPIIA
jgi:hypothetical protein